MSLPSGTRFGQYEVLSLVGQGGMGEVYRGRDTRLRRDVAIKVLPALFAQDAERVARFEREAQMLAALNHPHIATVHGIEETESARAIVMELVDGPTLADIIARGAMAPDHALAIAKQIATALDAAHEQGIVHRDLKPANIKVRDDGTVKVLDFGLAKAMASDAGGSQADQHNSPTMTAAAPTAKSVVLGTAAYMSPEQARGRAVDKRTDIWAFGVVLFEMLSGRQLFLGETVTDTLAAVLTREIDWSVLPPKAPPGRGRLLHRCLEREPRKRLRDIADARWDMEDVAVAPSAADLALVSRGGRTLAWAFGALVLALVSVAWATWSGGPAAPTRVSYFEMTVPRDLEPVPTTAAGFGLAPDGRRVFVTASRSGARRPLVRSLDNLEALELGEPEGVSGAAFSPDGTRLALLRSSGVVATFSFGDTQRTTVINGADQSGLLVWGEVGIVYSSNGALRLVQPDGQQPRSLTTLEAARGEVVHGEAVTLPGGRVVLFSVQTRDASSDRIEAVEVATGARSVVVDRASTPVWSATGHLLFERDGALFAAAFDASTARVTGPAVSVVPAGTIAAKSTGGLAVQISPNGTLAYVPVEFGLTRLLAVARNGSAIDLELPPGAYSAPRVSPEQRRVVVTKDSREVLVVDLNRGSATRLGPPAYGVSYGIWSGDGLRAVFRLFSIPVSAAADGTGKVSPIPGTVSNDYPSAAGPDADSVFITRIVPGQSGDVYLISLTGAYPPKALVTSPGYDGGAMLSPDGRWLLYYSTMSGQGEAYVTPYPGVGRQWQVSAGGGRQVRWSADGREIFYRGDGKFMAVTFSGAGLEPVIGKPTPLFTDTYDFGTAISLATYDVTRDGRFIFTRREQGAPVVRVIENWATEMRRIQETGGVK